MTEDELREKLARYPLSAIQGIFYRATLLGRDPLTSSYRGGRWMPPDTTSVLYVSFSRQGALAEISFRLGLNTPIPKVSIRVHQLRVFSPKALVLSRPDLETLDVDFSRFQDLDYDWTQKIGLASAQIGATAIQVPSARWATENLVAIDDAIAGNSIELINSEVVDWIDWARTNAPHFLPAD